MGRALLTTLATLAVLLATAVLLGGAVGGPTLPALSALGALDPDALGTGLRLLAWAALATLTALLVARIGVAAALLAGVGYAPLAYAGQALLLPVVRRTAGGIAAGVMVTTQVIGGASVGRAQGSPRGAVVAMAPNATTAPPRSSPTTGPGAGSAQAQPAGDVDARQAPPARSRPGGRQRWSQQVSRGLLGRARAGRSGTFTYTVQAGDTLSGVAALLYGDARAYPRLLVANRGLAQPDGARLTNADLIRAGWRLRVPLPSPVVSLGADGALRYVVQEGDSLSEISAFLLGDWRRYPELLALNRGQAQPGGAALTAPTLIQPGWVLRLPAEGVHPPSAAPAPSHRAAEVGSPAEPAPGRRQITPTSRVRRVVAARLLSRRPAPLARTGGATHPRDVPGLAAGLPPGRVYRALPPLSRAAHRPVSPQGERAALVHTLPAPPSGTPVRRPPSPAMAPLAQLGRQASQPVRRTPRTRPVVGLPDGRLLPTGLLATFLGLCALVAWRRRRRVGGTAAPWLLTTAPITSSVHGAVRLGMKGWLAAAASGRMRGDEATRLAPALAALGDLWAERGWGAPQVSSVRETDSALVVALAADPAVARDLAALGPDLARVVGCAGSDVRATRTGALLELHGVPAVVRGDAPPPVGDAATPAAAWGPASAPHPLPLLLPLGTDATAAVLHVNLAILPTLLIASGPRGNAPRMLFSLLAHVVAQAQPSQARLLLAGEAGGPLEALSGLPHASGSVVSVDDPAALSRLLDAAEAAQMAHLSRAARPGGMPMPPAPPPSTLLVIDEVSALVAYPALAVRLDALCRAGVQAGVAVLASTQDVAALCAPEARGLLSAFAGRLVSQLDDAASSVACLGEEGAEALEEDELYWSTGERAPERLRGFTLRESEAREILAAVAAAASPGSPPLTLLPTDGASGDAEEENGADQCGPDDVEGLSGDGADQTPPSVLPLTDPGAVSTGADPQGVDAVQPTRQASSDPDGASPGQPAQPNSADPVEPEAETPDQPAPEESGATGPGTPAPVESGAAPPGPTAEGIRGSGSPALASPPLHGTPAPGVLPHLWLPPCVDLPLSLRVLGGLDVAVFGQVVSVGKGRLSRSLREYLAYLALRRGLPRERRDIQCDFWPDASPEAGKINFHGRRAKLIDYLTGLPGLPAMETLLPKRVEQYWLAMEYVWADVVAFEEALDVAGGADVEPGDALTHLLTALALYGGDLFGSTQPRWAEDEAQRLRGRFLDAAVTACKMSARACAFETALIWGERLIREEPLEEEYYRLLMKVQAAAGQRAAVARIYERLRAELGEDGQEAGQPEDRTHRVYARLMAAPEPDEAQVRPEPAPERQVDGRGHPRAQGT